MDELPCSAGHSACYISAYGDVHPCVQVPVAPAGSRITCFRSVRGMLSASSERSPLKCGVIGARSKIGTRAAPECAFRPSNLGKDCQHCQSCQ